MTLIKGAESELLLQLEDNVPYPKVSTTPSYQRLRDLLLPQAGVSRDDTRRHYVLPKNSTTLVTVLNEASGATTGVEHPPLGRRATELMGILFSNLGIALRGIRDESRVVPVGLTYDKVLVRKEDVSFKLLPPLELIDVTEDSTASLAWQALRTTFMKSIQGGATTDYQRAFASAIKPIVEESFYER